MIRVAITDDHPLVVQGLKDMLSGEQDLLIVASFADAASTRKGLPAARADLLLLDINLPDMDGTELCTLLHADLPELGIIALTSYEEVSMVKAMLRHGAHGYLLKTVSREELVEAIRTVHGGEQYIQAGMRERILNDALGNKVTSGGPPRLTRREKEVLALILDELTTPAIAEKLHISPKTVESHRAVLFQKFGVRNVAGLVKQAIEHGMG